MPQHIHLVRHGETAWSLTGQHTGTTNLDLTAHGAEQARSLASMLRPWIPAMFCAKSGQFGQPARYIQFNQSIDQIV